MMLLSTRKPARLKKIIEKSLSASISPKKSIPLIIVEQPAGGEVKEAPKDGANHRKGESL